MTLETALPRADASGAESVRTSGYRKATLRIIPFLFVCYFFAYLDRVNVGFAKLHMLSDLQFSEAVYGLGAGIFFIGYFFFELPSNLIMHRVGARRWISRIMISWGLISAAMAFVTTPAMFYILRFLLGVAEAGFFPGIILYLTYWYPAERRGRIVSMFMAAIPVSGLLGSPLSGYILDSFQGVHGFAAWQWLFVIEALPSCILGVILFFSLADKPAQARWLTRPEIDSIEADLAAETAKQDSHSLKAALSDGRVWLLCLLYFGIQMGVYGMTFWLPTIVKGSGFSSGTMIGVMTAIPYLAATIFMIAMGRSADASRRRRLHVAVPIVLGTIGLVGSAAFAGNPAIAIACLTLATMGTLTALVLFWSLPTAFLGGLAAAGGLAIINSVGNLAGFVSPYLVGLIKDATQSTNPALYVIAIAVLGSGLLLLRVPTAVDR
ncbi:MFS transporter [Reyranella sp. CPCC 100927]|uniref:MFS transporter n=1 Tax=Reyranella sp. CPCC 100927 TaxID=2599616 RepID=UPI0011B7FB1D|nr:MFS transporter [Reyranella sp. CPCC 100927]TWS96130.1 MFS transporter [Reyranella sp. CPCC 100927]